MHYQDERVIFEFTFTVFKLAFILAPFITLGIFVCDACGFTR